MTGTVFGSFGMPLSPWQAAHSCTFASMSSARIGAAETANPMTTATIVAARRAALMSFLPLVIAHDCGKYPDKARREQPDPCGPGQRAKYGALPILGLVPARKWSHPPATRRRSLESAAAQRDGASTAT